MARRAIENQQVEEKKDTKAGKSPKSKKEKASKVPTTAVNDNEMHNYLVEIRKMQNVLMKKMQNEEKANKEAIEKE